MKLRNFAIAAGVAALTLTGIAPAGANENNTNNPDNWVGAAAAAAGVDPEMISCYDDSFGSIVEGGTAVELDPYTGDGSGYVLLVVKGGAVDYGWGDGNAEPVEYPVAGTPYFTPLNGGGQQAGVSHWIVCVDDTVPTPPVDEPPTPPIPPQPDDKIVYGEYAEGEWVCGDTTVTLTRGFTVTPYVWNGEEWVLDTANATSGVEAKLRDLTEEELASCVEEPPTPPTPPTRRPRRPLRPRRLRRPRRPTRASRTPRSPRCAAPRVRTSPTPSR